MEGYMKELDKDKVARLKEAAFYGMNKTAMARYAGICRTTLNNWLRENEEFKDAILESRGDGDLEVAKALHEEATTGRNSSLLVHLSKKRLKNSEFNNDWGDGLDKEETEVKLVLSPDSIDARLAELVSKAGGE
jgi:DNA-binding XRE family transcriptional regulator